MATDTTTNPTPQPNLQTGGNPTDFMKAIQDKLLTQSGVISSTNSDLEAKLSSAITGIKNSTNLSNQKIESEFGRELGYRVEKAGEELTAGRTAGSGGILNMAALREFTATTDKSLKDLAQRKQELILANDSAGAAKISEMEIQAIDFRQKAQQSVFSNLLGIANLGIQSAQEVRLAKQQTFQEEQSMSTIALQYGITLKPGDTLQSVTTRAMPFASKEQQLSLAKLQSEINRNNADAAKALKGDASGVTDLSIPTLVNQALIFDAAGKTPTTDPEYANLIGTITKAGKIDQYYKSKQQTALAKIEAEKKAVTTPSVKPKQKANLLDSVANWGARLMGE